jgi:hypothetical protein
MRVRDVIKRLEADGCIWHVHAAAIASIDTPQNPAWSQ